ncbi:hypothetical protein V6N13_067661 [Hibiscus sabdariffa]|uniref:Hexosyltransferase n=1 Tax=Hibiscus sabdariffa TaxID=183260 RepID=A0ABR2DUH6_9ROSI
MLFYGDEFQLGVRVLGKSIKNTGSSKDMFVLVSDGVSDYAKKLLKADDGCTVEKISLLENPNQVRPKRFWGVYTKLKLFNMTNYKKVVYVDADAIVVKSKVKTLPSYTGEDQGFPNSYYSDFPNAHVFDPDMPPDVLKSRPAVSSLYIMQMLVFTCLPTRLFLVLEHKGIRIFLLALIIHQIGSDGGWRAYFSFLHDICIGGHSPTQPQEVHVSRRLQNALVSYRIYQQAQIFYPDSSDT